MIDGLTGAVIGVLIGYALGVWPGLKRFIAAAKHIEQQSVQVEATIAEAKSRLARIDAERKEFESRRDMYIASTTRQEQA